MPESLWSQFFGIVLEEVGRMWWFFLLSVVLVGLIKGYKLDLRIRDSVNRAGVLGIVIAVAVGMVSPLCACGILPIVISLALVRTPLPPLLALLATSPVMGPDALLLTWRGLGAEWAVLKLIGAAIMGLSVGFLTDLLVRRGPLSGDLVRLRPVFRDDGSPAPAYEVACANNIRVRTMTVTPRANRLRFIFDRTLDAALFVGKFLLLAIVLEALLVTFVPVGWVSVLVGRKTFSSVVLASLIGLPLPANQIPMIPILAGLLDRGIDPGAALTLFMAGPVTSIPAVVALFGIFRRRVVLWYLLICLLSAVLLGLAYQLRG